MSIWCGWVPAAWWRCGQTAGAGDRDDASALARFQLQSIVLAADVKSDTSMKARFSLHRCELDDIRPGRDAGITRSVEPFTRGIKFWEFNPLTPTVAIWVSYKASLLDWVKPSFVVFWHPGTLMLRARHQSAQMSKIANDGLTRSGTGCFIAVPMWQLWASKG